jgi:hypothetical protein
VFERLCLRDLIKYLKIFFDYFLVCKRWHEAAKIVWSLKKKLVLNNENIFENYMPIQKSNYGFTKKPSKISPF